MFKNHILTLLVSTTLSILLLHPMIVLAQRIPFIAPYTAYPSLANPPIKPYDSSALFAIVNLINPPHLKLLKRVPARLVDKNYRGFQNPEVSARKFKDLPHFDTPTFSYFPDINNNVLNLPKEEISENRITSTTQTERKGNPYSHNEKVQINANFNQNQNSTKSERNLDSFVTRGPQISNESRLVSNTKVKPVSKFGSDFLEKPTGRRIGGDIPIIPNAEVSSPSSDYSYNYSVSDHVLKDVKSHSEVRNGDIVTGEYSILEPDGYTRVVSYYSDKYSGFKARVIRIPPLKPNNLI